MRTGRAPSGVFGILVFASVGLMSISLAAPPEKPAAQVSEIASIPLTDDDGNQALFAVTALGPGRPVTRCLEVRYAGAASPGDVRLLAEDVTGALASRLAVRVERGTGGGFASCAGFAGSTVFNGTLTGLASGSAGASGVATGWVPAANDARTYRITVDVSGAASPGQSSTATFRWLIVPQPDPPAPAPTATTPAPITAAPDPGTATTSPTTGATAPVPPTASPSPPAGSRSPTPRPATTDAAPSSGNGPGSGQAGGGTSGADASGSGLSRFVERIVASAYEVGRRTVRHSGLPIASIIVLILFLVVQNRIDARDPKLAMAPVIGDPYLAFGAEQPEQHDPSGGVR